MKVLVIGGAGYIGSHVSKALIKDGNEITVYDNLSTGLKENLQPGSKFIKGDIMDYKKLVKSLRGFDALIHLAAFKAAGESMINPEKYSINNISGTLNIINAASETGVKKIVFSSSAATFGEPQYLPLDEKHPQDPENYYGFTKLEIERFLDWYDKLRSIRFASLRYFNAAGYDIDGEICGLEKNPANLLPIVMEVAAGIREKVGIFGNDYNTEDGTGVRDYVHVTDLAIAHVKALHWITDNDKSLKVNLGSETGISVLQMIESARKITGKEIKAEIQSRRPGDPAKLVATSTYAHEVLKWKAQYSDVDTLIRTSWNAYRKALKLK